MKNFDKWNQLKTLLENDDRILFCNQREIWWASVGMNIGSEQDGKNDLFERPVLVIKVFGSKTVLVVPFSSKRKNKMYRIRISFQGKNMFALIHQIRTLSTKRFIRKIGRLDINSVEEIKSQIKVQILK